ncbi:MAG: proton-conducting transporter membrane subunit [Nannocystaceae bacterium]
MSDLVDSLSQLAPLAILGLWSLLLVAVARARLQGLAALHRGIALVGVALAAAAALALVGDPAIDVGVTVLGGALIVDPLAALVDLALLAALAATILLSRRDDAPGIASAVVIAAGLMLTIHAVDLLPMVAGLEIGALGLVALLGRDPAARPAALRWLVGQGILSATLLFGVALIVAATGTTAIAEIGGRAAMIFTRWGAGPAQIAVDLLTSGVPIPEALEGEARRRAVTAMAPAALFLPGMLLVFASLALRFGVAFGHRLLTLAYDRAAPMALVLIAGLRLAALVALLRLFVAGLHVPRQLFAPYGWSTPAVLLIAATLAVGGVIALRGRELRRWLAGQAIVSGGWLLLAALAAANFYAHAGLRGGSLTVMDHHEWGLASGDAAVAAILGLALAEGLAAAGLAAIVAAVGDPRARGPLALRGLARRRPLVGGAAALLLLALVGAPPTAVFIARFELLLATITDTNLPVRVLVGVAMLAAVLVAAGALRHLAALFARPAAGEEPAPTRAASAVAVVAAALVLLAGSAPEVLRRSLELAACGAGLRPGPHSRGDRLEALRLRWAGIEPAAPEDVDAPAAPVIEPALVGPAASPGDGGGIELDKDPR